MKLKDLESYSSITIQCHDNPDADALASGYGIYCYFKKLGKKTKLVYSGRNQIRKANLKLMIDKLHIPIEHLKQPEPKKAELLITVDCQYGAGNVSKLPAKAVAVIDHHQQEIELAGIAFHRIEPGVGSCSTLVWELLREADYSVEQDEMLGTALYYGLYTDTNQFATLENQRDFAMREQIPVKHKLVSMFQNSNITLQELEMIGIAMIRYIFNDDYNYAIIHAKPCDPNILGLISDILIQVDTVWTCVVYNEEPDGYKLSVRSCVPEVEASELAAFLCDVIGSGGGKTDKAGGFISMPLYEAYYPTLHSEAYLSQRMNEYFDG